LLPFPLQKNGALLSPRPVIMAPYVNFQVVANLAASITTCKNNWITAKHTLALPSREDSPRDASGVEDCPLATTRSIAARAVAGEIQGGRRPVCLPASCQRVRNVVALCRTLAGVSAVCSVRMRIVWACHIASPWAAGISKWACLLLSMLGLFTRGILRKHVFSTSLISYTLI